MAKELQEGLACTRVVVHCAVLMHKQGLRGGGIRGKTHLQPHHNSPCLKYIMEYVDKLESLETALDRGSETVRQS